MNVFDSEEQFKNLIGEIFNDLRNCDFDEAEKKIAIISNGFTIACMIAKKEAKGKKQQGEEKR